ncbi:hypothetical protein CTEN210_07036 [Chaetoceros tenuissimus]|uniref:Integrase catalytic domain-containing protein n=1 Tax=Chaetoceros tenuissimus TaxID=426638 RepID=A0AAD3CT25_9STRA|nr:hypothetical protein CTEN210_07036 [Chaetoceros tenuissimus]
MPLSQRYRTDLLSQRLRRISTRVYTDTLLMKSKSSRSNTCAQVFTDGALAYVHPMQSKADAHEGLAAFGQDVGIPMEIISDNSIEQTAYGSDFMKILHKWRTSSCSIELYSPWQNLAENVIGILKSKWKCRMVRRNVPAIFKSKFVHTMRLYLMHFELTTSSDLDGFDRMINEDVPLVKETETGYSVHDDIAVPEIDDIVDHDDAVKQQDTYDMCIGAEVLFPNAVGDEQMGKVVKRIRKNDGESSNTGSYNLLHDTALYQVEFPSGLTENIQANIIAKNMFTQVDSEGHQPVGSNGMVSLRPSPAWFQRRLQ